MKDVNMIKLLRDSPSLSFYISYGLNWTTRYSASGTFWIYLCFEKIAWRRSVNGKRRYANFLGSVVVFGIV